MIDFASFPELGQSREEDYSGSLQCSPPGITILLIEFYVGQDKTSKSLALVIYHPRLLFPHFLSFFVLPCLSSPLTSHRLRPF